MNKIMTRLKLSYKKIKEVVYDHTLWYLIVALVTLIGTSTGIKSYIDNVPWSTYFNDPQKFISPAIGAILVLAIIILFKAILRYRKINMDLTILINGQQKTLQGLGILKFSRHDNDEVKKIDWENVQDAIRDKTKIGRLWILGGTGYDTFSSPNSPLYSLLENVGQTPVEILLLMPFSKGFNQRVESLVTNEAKYLDDILSSINRCAELKKTKGLTIELKLYTEYSIWKMIMVQSKSWIQYYALKRHVDDTPMYTFVPAGEEDDLYTAYHTIFTKRWKHDKNPAIDLDNWSMKDVKKKKDYWWPKNGETCKAFK
jgi:hypothetical protein